MAETPSFKFQFEYPNPSNVEAEVPGAQKLREARGGPADGNATLGNGDTVENPITNSAGGLKADTDETKHRASRTVTYTEVLREVVKDGQVVRTGYQVTSDDKRNGDSDKNITEDKRSKTRIPMFRQTVESVKAERRGSKDKKDHETHIPVRTSSIPKPSKESRIPPTSVKKELTITKTEIKREITEPDDEFDKIYEEIVASTPTKVIFDDKLMYNKIDDPEKLDTKFEEIIHNYDENKTQPVNVERVRRSKIPFLKRKSEQEIEIPNAMDRTSKIIAARDKIRLRNSIPRPVDTSNMKLENETNNHDVTHRYTKIVTTKQVSVDNDKDNETANDVKSKTSTVINETFNIETKSFEDKDIAESKTNIRTEATNDNEQKSNKEFPVIIPVLNSYIKEQTEAQETEKTVKIKKTLEWTSKTDDFEIKRDISETKRQETKTPETFQHDDVPSREPDVEAKAFEIKFETKSIDIIINPSSIQTVESNVQNTDIRKVKKEADNNHSETPVKEKDSNVEEELAELRGKVSRLINKIDSKDLSASEVPEKDIPDEIPKKKSVLSRIAMFERQPEEPCAKPRAILSDAKPLKIMGKDMQIDNAEHVHVHTPKIVDEVFKPFQGKRDSNNNDDKVEITASNDNILKPNVPAAAEPIQHVSHNEVKFEIESNNLELKHTEIYGEPLTPVQGNLNCNGMKQELSWEIIKSVEDRVKLPEHFKEAVVYERIENTNSIENISKQTHLTIQNSTTMEMTAANTPTVTEVNAKLIESTPVNLILDDFQLNNKNHRDENAKHVNDETVSKETNNYEQAVVKCRRTRIRFDDDDIRRTKSLAELDLGDAVKGKVNRMIVRMKSVERFEHERKETINIKERPLKRSVSEKIALFEGKLTPVKMDTAILNRTQIIDVEPIAETCTSADYQLYAEKIAELKNAKLKYGTLDKMPSRTLRTGAGMPVLAVGTATLDPMLIPDIIGTAIDLGYRAIDCGYIYGNEKAVGEAIKAKIIDGTVSREDLFIISKLWSTNHRTDLVEPACRASLNAMGLDYFDLYMIHNPMSLKEGRSPIPKIATVMQYSEHDYLDAWYGMEGLVSKGLAKAIGVSNFNSVQIQRVMDKGKIKPAVNQVECHPYLTQQRLGEFCTEHKITLSCFGVLGSKGTPAEYKSGLPPAIDDALVQVMASGLNVTPAQLLIRYQLDSGHGVVVKSSTGAHLWDNLQALKFKLTRGQVEALNALNRNKRTFTFTGMGDTHKNYPFNIAF